MFRTGSNVLTQSFQADSDAWPATWWLNVLFMQYVYRYTCIYECRLHNQVCYSCMAADTSMKCVGADVGREDRKQEQPRKDVVSASLPPRLWFLVKCQVQNIASFLSLELRELLSIDNELWRYNNSFCVSWNGNVAEFLEVEPKDVQDIAHLHVLRWKIQPLSELPSVEGQPHFQRE